MIKRILKKIFNELKITFIYYYYRIFRSKETFIFNGKTYYYFCHKYNTTWRNERAIEVPIIWDIVREYSRNGKRVLEVGNVLSHYFPIFHDVVDKYEVAKGVINQDVVDFKPAQRYDLIVSISTLEHVGQDEELKEHGKVLKAFENLKQCLNPRGKIIVTLPLGYNPYLDELLRKGKIKFTEQYYLKKNRSKWKEVDWNDCCNEKYDFIHHTAKALIFDIYYNQDIRL